MSDSSAAGISALTGAFISLSVVAVGARFLARHKLKAPFMIDDWLMLLALTSFIGLSALVLRLVHIKVLGYSSFQFTAAEIVARYNESVKLQTALVALIITCLACTKASALLFYKRIFCIRGRRRGVFDILLLTSTGIVACWFVTFLFLDIFQCQGHFSGLWNPKVYASECGVTWRFLYGFSISDVLLDILVLALPIPSIFRLRITLSKKLSILAICMLACVAVAASLVRMVIYIRIYILGVDRYNKLDSEHILTRYVFYYVLECGCSVVAINLPSVWPLINGHGLENIMKMASSVTSLASRSIQSFQWSTGKSTPTERSESDAVNTEVSHGEKSGNMVDVEDLSASDRRPSARLEIMRHDTVQISSALRRPEDAHRKEEAW